MKTLAVDRHIVLITATLVPVAWLNSQAASQDGTEARQLAAVRSYGLTNDRSKIPVITSAMTPTTTGLLPIARIRALVTLQAFDSIPVLDSVIQRNPDPDLRAFAEVCRARLVSEQVGAAILDPLLRAQTELGRFMAELRLTSDLMNSARARQDENRRRRTHPGTLRDLYALRELADMTYRRRFRELQTAAAVQGIHFDSDAPSALKIRLAFLSASERQTTLIGEISQKRILSRDDYYPIQLAIDGGLATGQACETKLLAMRLQRENFGHMGFAGLFSVIEGIGSAAQSPIIESFLNDPNEWVRHYAMITHRALTAATPKVVRPAF